MPQNELEMRVKALELKIADLESNLLESANSTAVANFFNDRISALESSVNTSLNLTRNRIPLMRSNIQQMHSDDAVIAKAVKTAVTSILSKQTPTSKDVEDAVNEAVTMHTQIRNKKIKLGDK